MNKNTFFLQAARLTIGLSLQVLLVVLSVTHPPFSTQSNHFKQIENITSADLTSASTTKNVQLTHQEEISHPIRSLETEFFFEKSLELFSQFNTGYSDESIYNHKTPKYAQAGLCAEKCYKNKIEYYFTAQLESLQKKYRHKIALNPTRPECLPRVQVTINRNGSITEIGLLKTSGNKAFDNLFIQAFKKAAPFPSIPPQIMRSEFVIYT
ncbi:TonB C-terminal domain-containing protein [Candidatus Dependentiae bacterium]|nr:TonB C-terminal domain-containing protein [Candidatus Dependentiae bacterium]